MLLDTLEDSLGVDGIGGTAVLIWLGIGVLGLIGSMIYIPQKRKQERITELENAWQLVLSEITQISRHCRNELRWKSFCHFL